ncbi:OmpA family protein [bacterium]|nr:OmpA family protein [bacterium]
MALPPDDPPPGVPEWVVTYGDMMSLLLTFFIMLVSMAEIKQEGKLRMMMDSLQERFGPTEGQYGVPGQVFSKSSSNPGAASRGNRNEGGTEKMGIESAGLAGPSRTVKRIGDGTQITLGGPALFHRFSADLTEAAKSDLEIIANIIGPRPNRIVVRGHASRESLPADSPFHDSVDLSFQRALHGAEFLMQCGIARERIAVTAAGDSEPRTISRDPDSQAQNHRIDVFVIDEYTTPSAAAAPDSSATRSVSRQRLPSWELKVVR